MKWKSVVYILYIVTFLQSNCEIGICTSKYWKKLVKSRWPCHRKSVSHISVFGTECRSSDVSDARRYYFSLHIRDLFEHYDQSTYNC